MKHGETSLWRKGGTTIIATLEAMAADTRVSVEGSAFYHADKLIRIGDSIFGGAGDGMMCLIMFDWLKNKARSRKKLYENWTEHTERSACWLLELNPDGLFVWDGWGIPEPLNEERYAIGSGAAYALATLDAGGSLEEAVETATKYDQYSGGPFSTMYLKEEDHA